MSLQCCVPFMLVMCTSESPLPCLPVCAYVHCMHAARGDRIEGRRKVTRVCFFLQRRPQQCILQYTDVALLALET